MIWVGEAGFGNNKSAPEKSTKMPTKKGEEGGEEKNHVERGRW